ncbi:MAG: Nif3-like dinuclear metal center hexameric protein [Syntrophomonadaceae bacterium]|jgi:dinuclear metal center YbgI/SA1388 family protein
MQATVKDIVRIMETEFPPRLAEHWDNSGLQVGSYNALVKKVMVALDVDHKIIEQAVAEQVDMIITHHPLLFKPVKSINLDLPPGNIISQLIRHNICLYSAHTNLDAAAQGLNQLLAETLGLAEISALDNSRQQAYYKLVVFVPATHLEEVRQAILAAGAGYIGNYSDCSFCTRGTGTFKPLAGTHPFIGDEGHCTEVEEFRLETIVPQHLITRVVKNMLKVHPYEEVAYDLYCLANEGQVISLGRKGYLDQPVDLKSFAAVVKQRLHIDHVRVAGDLNKMINKVAVVSGAGASFITTALSQHIDVLVTGDVKYHEARDAVTSGLAIIDAGHQGTEEIVVPYLKAFLADKCQKAGLNVIVSDGYADQGLITI